MPRTKENDVLVNVVVETVVLVALPVPKGVTLSQSDKAWLRQSAEEYAAEFVARKMGPNVIMGRARAGKARKQRGVSDVDIRRRA